jgi:hypothetical protein
MIRNDTEQVVRELRQTLKDNAEGHAKQIMLDEEISKRLGE